jgi:5,10-methylenetetrahydromethanopterin reductase
LGLALLADYLGPDEIVKLYVQGEKSGFSTLWVTEHFCSGDAISILGALAYLTEKAKLGTGIIGVNSRHPVLTAMTFSSLNMLSRGRMILGLGTGVLAWLDQLGLKHDKPVLLVKEALSIVRALFNGETVNFDGMYFKVRNMRLGQYLSSASIPIYLAAVGPDMLKFAGQHADGVVLTAGSSLKYVQTAKKHINTGQNMSRDQKERPSLLSLMICAVDDDDSLAVDQALSLLSRPGRVKQMLADGTYDEANVQRLVDEAKRGRTDIARKYLTDEMIDQVLVRGSVSECERKIWPYIEAGVDIPVIMPLSPNPSRAMELARRFAC